MNMAHNLPGNISVTPAVVDKVRDGYSRVRDIADPVGSIEWVTPQDESKPSFWALSWFSRQYAPVQTLFKIEDIELAIGEDAQDRLRGKVVDFREGRLVILDRMG